ncbi:MAG: diaminopimelate epimerase [Candidatus Coatesbacteria bacterium]|nr:diaminopimelate epimerase [Candidatus Coatesbacteria bacterium]
MKFSKYQAIGNDFIMVTDTIAKGHSETIRKLCDRHFGIGSDGLIIAEESRNKEAHLFMDYYNSDGSVAEMCGNGIRCLAKYAYEELCLKTNPLVIDTRNGVKYCELEVVDDEVRKIKVNMGKASFNPEDLPAFYSNQRINSKEVFNGEELVFTLVSVGNPHIVIFTKNLSDKFICKMGPFLEFHEKFPNRINVNFAEVIDRSNINLRVWERGCGETLACGTGATASFAALLKSGLIDQSCKINLRGGSLLFEKDIDDNLIMIGSAEKVYDGEIGDSFHEAFIKTE